MNNFEQLEIHFETIEVYKCQFSHESIIGNILL